MKLNAILQQGQAYLAQCQALENSGLSLAVQAERGRQLLRQHSDAMAAMDAGMLEALVAACLGACKAHERKAACGGHLGDAVAALEDAVVGLKLDRLEEEAAAEERGEVEHAAPYERLSGEQLGLRCV